MRANLYGVASGKLRNSGEAALPPKNQSTAFVIAARDYILQLRTVADGRSVDELQIGVYPCLHHILG